MEPKPEDTPTPDELIPNSLNNVNDKNTSEGNICKAMDSLDGNDDDWEQLAEELEANEINDNSGKDTKQGNLDNRKENTGLNPEKVSEIWSEATGATALDVSGFPTYFKTVDIMAIFDQVGGMRSSPKIKWIDDDHCLVLFGSPKDARRAYLRSCTYPFAKITPSSYSEHSNNNRATSDRPATTDAVARRLIAGALGIRAPKKQNADIDRKIMERQRIRDKETNNAWEGP